MADPYVTTPATTAAHAQGPGGYSWLIAGLGVLFGGLAVVTARANPDSLAPWFWLLFPVVFIGGDTLRARRGLRA